MTKTHSENTPSDALTAWRKAFFTKQRGQTRWLFSRVQEETKQAMSENQWIENNRRVIEEFHTNGGRVQRWPPLILLTTTGAGSCALCVVPGSSSA
jgi:hypothetical protein